MKSEQASKRTSLFPFFLLLVVITLVSFWQVKDFDFVNFDDIKYLHKNPEVAGGLTWQGVQWALRSNYMSNWHPLTWAAHMTVIQFFGLNPLAHHLINLGFHVLNVLLLFWVLYQLTGAAYRSALVAALFAVHPLHVESVAWVAELKDVLSTFFWAFSALAYVQYVRGQKKASYAFCLVLFALGLMAKPMVITLPLIFLLLDYWPLRRWTSRAAVLDLIWEKIPFFFLSGISALLTLWAQASHQSLLTIQELPFGIRMANAAVVYVKYLGKMLWPHPLAALYPRVESRSAWEVLSALFLLVLMTLFFLRRARRNPYLPVGWFWYLITLVPVIGLVSVGSQEMADRYAYLPSIGAGVALIWGAADLASGWKIPKPGLLSLSAFILLACILQTRSELGHWRNSVSLWEHTLKVTSENYVARVQLGNAYLDAHDYQKAEENLREAMKIKDDDWMGHNSLANALTDNGKLEEAVKEYQEVLRLNPNSAQGHYNLGYTYYFNLENSEGARKHLNEALRLNPDFAEAHYVLSVIGVKDCRIDEAIRHAREALRIRPDYEQAENQLKAIGSLEGLPREEQEKYCEGLRTIEDAKAINKYREITSLVHQIKSIPR